MELLDLTEAALVASGNSAMGVGQLGLGRGIITRRQVLQIGGTKKPLGRGPAINDGFQFVARHGGKTRRRTTGIERAGTMKQRPRENVV